MNYLLDTDVLIYYFNRKEPYTGLVEALLNTAPVSLSVLTLTEIRTGWTPEKADLFMSRLRDLFSLDAVTEEIAEQAGVWRHDYKTKGEPLSVPDTVIAATAYLNGYCLVTNNSRHYPMSALNLYKDVLA